MTPDRLSGRALDMRELNLRVHREVFEKFDCWAECPYVSTGVWEERNGTLSYFCRVCGDPGGYHQEPPNYVESIASAWLVVEKLSAVHRQVVVRANAAGDYYVVVRERLGIAYEDVAEAEEDSAPLAICLAALECVRSSLPSPNSDPNDDK